MEHADLEHSVEPAQNGVMGALRLWLNLPSITCSPDSSTAGTTGMPNGELQFGTGGDSWGQAAPAQPAALSAIRACAGECMASKLIALFICLIKLERCHQRVE